MISLSFEIDPELYKRAMTHPMLGQERPSKLASELRNVAAAVLFPFSLFCLSMAFFDKWAILPMSVGAVVTGMLVLGVWWRQHKKLLRVHMRYNETGGQQTMTLDVHGIKVEKPHIQSNIEWPFVTSIRAISGATLIDVQTARLIVPDVVLGTTPDTFRAQVNTWWQQ